MSQIEKYHAIARDHDRVVSLVEDATKGLATNPADADAIARFGALLKSEMPYPSDLFREVIEASIHWYEKELLPDASAADKGPLETARDAFRQFEQSLMAPDPTPLLASEQALRDLGIKYSRRSDGMIEVGTLEFGGKLDKRLPDLSNVIVMGDFIVANNALVTLAGAPRYVRGNISVFNNALRDLSWAPDYVGGDFIASKNRLASLRHGPGYVGGNYSAVNNQLTSIEGAPREMAGILAVRGNPQLKHLEHAPEKFGELQSDLGMFKTADEIPEALRMDPEERERLKKEFMQSLAKHAKGLTAPVSAPKTARFTRR